MILLVHMLFGAAIGSAVSNVPLAIILALLGHYFLDIFPHIEYLQGVEEAIGEMKDRQWRRHLGKIIKVFIDFCLGILLIYLFSKNHPLVYICAIVAIVPDGLTVIYSLFPNAFLRLHHVFHADIIHFSKHKKISRVWRVSSQIIVIIVSILLIHLY